MLQGGEQRVELGQMSAVVCFELVDLANTSGERALKSESWGHDAQLTKVFKMEVSNSNAFCSLPDLLLNRRGSELC